MNFQKHTLKIGKSWLLLLLPIFLAGCTNQTKQEKQEKQVPSPSPIVTEEPSPAPTEQAVPVNQTVGQASTKIFDNLANRNQNLALAIQAIDGKTLSPGEEFSFNQTVGPRTKEKGYLEAIGYDEHGDKVPTVGGGVCQISSTLYMAAKNGGFPVIERHSHSHSVPYADSNNDATVSYGGYDFKFQNHLDMPVIIRISTDGEMVAAELIQTSNIKSP